MTNDLIREVNEAMQQERLHQLWKRYAGRILYSCAAIVAVAGGLIVWQQREQTLSHEHSAALMEHRELFMNQRYEEARDGFAGVAEQSGGDLATIARLWLAKSELMLENHQGALEALAGAVNPDPADANSFEALACIQGAMLDPSDTRFTACLPQLPEQPLFGMAREHEVVEAAVKHDFEKAASLLPAYQLPLTQQRRMDDMKAYVQHAGSLAKDAKR